MHCYFLRERFSSDLAANMEAAFLRFPHLSENIFNSLDNKSLADCKEVNKSWYFYLSTQKFLQTRIIKANKIQKVEDTIEIIRKIDFKRCPRKFTEIDARSIMKKAKDGQFDLVHKKIRLKIKEYYKSNSIDYAFNIAARWGHFNVVKYIVDNSEDKNPANCRGETPLHEAAFHGHLAIVSYIMGNIEDKSPKNCFGETPLHAAAKTFYRCPSIIRKLDVFKHIFEIVDEKNPADLRGITPLHLAAMWPKVNFVKYILKNIGDTSPKDHDGRTPLHFAAFKEGQSNVYEYIIKNVDEKFPEDNEGNTPLDWHKKMFGL